MESNPFEEDNIERKKEVVPKLTPTFLELVHQEVSKILKGKQTPGVEQVNFAKISEYVGNAIQRSLCWSNNLSKYWIVDTSATNHVCSVRNFFTNLKPLKRKILMNLPYGTTKPFMTTGDITLHKSSTTKKGLSVATFRWQQKNLSLNIHF